MGELGGFLKIERSGVKYTDAVERLTHYKEFRVAHFTVTAEMWRARR